MLNKKILHHLEQRHAHKEPQEASIIPQSLERQDEIDCDLAALERVQSERLPTDVGSIGVVLGKVLKYDVVSDVSAGRAEVPASPKVAPPVALLEIRELLLQPSRGAPLDPSHHVRDGVLGRHRHEHVYVVPREHALDDGHAQLIASLPDDLPRALTDVAREHLVTIFCRPNNVIPMVEYAVSPEIISGHPYPLENETLTRVRGVSFSRG